MNRELIFLHGFHLMPHLGPAGLRIIKKHFGSYERAWNAPPAEIRESGAREETVSALLEHRKHTRPDEEYKKLEQEGVWMIADDDPHYPALLKEIPNPPVSLYGQGRQFKDWTPDELSLCFAVVGTRRPTSYGLHVSEQMIPELVRHHITIVSGLAVGIDTKAHKTALDHEGRTIAVLGSGLDTHFMFPQENRGLLKRIIESDSMVISEYPPRTRALPQYFPQRNRIISGLSKGILVVEAREKSGALITARFALEQNREVCAIPGSIFSATSQGPNQLIQEGAKTVLSYRDILEALGMDITQVDPKNTPAVSVEEASLLLLLEEALTIDEIKIRSNLAIPAIIASLSMLELKGLVRHLGSDAYERVM